MGSETDAFDAIFEYAWSQIDKPISGDFVYGKDLPKLIEIIENVFQEAQRNGSYNLRLPLLSETDKDLCRTFSNTKTFFKIHKDDFDDIFFNLVNRSLKEILEKTFDGVNSIPRDFMKSLDLDLSSKSLAENKGNSIQEPISLTPPVKHTESPIKRFGQSNTRNTLKVQVEDLQRELNMKQNLLLENERQVNELKRRLKTYQQKYASIQEQFNDLQKNRQIETNQCKPQTADAESHVAVGIDQEAILEEFKRRLQKQTETISTLKDQIRQERGINYNNDKTLFLKRKPSTSKHASKSFADTFSLNLWVNAIIRTIICLTLIIGVLSYVMKYLYSSDAPTQNSRLQLSWWENNGILSKIVWFFQDQTDLEIEYSSNAEIDDAYSRVFGI
ncbi:hypothetical protein SEUBUCD646_0G01970 [Saccharomyces eubayanus]|uniref:Monopolar spindle protein 2 n=1 Tax=Saccharomyces eubayanus TaxID=1080349 RepID=A0ABN8VVX3_SACEU|nr:hypothetical protein SEUBUCD650_0G01980 [Saccharomyces eubayanus]CAI2017087.1 hypothetical protein SEUBUCD646_0G01970 [Saccharomyces eubayanus]